VYPFRRRDEDEDEAGIPADDAGNFGLSERQRQIRKNRDTVKQMEKVANEIWASLREEYDRMKRKGLI
jgi:hypothetical protein